MTNEEYPHFFRIERELEELRNTNGLRSLRKYPGIDFGSNDYLGFATDPELKSAAIEALHGMAISSSSSRLLPGHHDEHLEAETYFATFIGAEAALLFNSGYDANFAVLTTLPSRHDFILYDENSHASIYDGAHSVLARKKKVLHNVPEQILKSMEECYRKQPPSQSYIVLESVYSMDGDVAALREIENIAEQFSSVLIVDEAHATGVLGERGEGLVAGTIKCGPGVVTIHTCGKALGAAGAFVAGSKFIIDYLINKARPFIFTTALPPIVPVQIMNAVKRLELEGDALVARLGERSLWVRSQLRKRLRRWTVSAGVTPIISIIIGSESNALRAAAFLEERGFHVPAIRPPTVPDGSSRLRLNVSLRHSEEELHSVVKAIVMAESDQPPDHTKEVIHVKNDYRLRDRYWRG